MRATLVGLVLGIAVVAACNNKKAAMVDAPNGPPCTGAVYDPCTMASQCMSNMCHLYTMSNFQVCTQACSTTNPCPNDSSGQPGACNNMGICKPAAANACTR